MSALVEGPHNAAVSPVELPGGIDAIVARPPGEPAMGIALAPDIGGLRPLFEDLCRRLATHGFAVCAVDQFAHLPRDQRAALDLPARLERARDLRDEDVVANLVAAADALACRRTAVMGFCMGGAQALKAAASGRFDRAVSFYGMIRTPPQWQGGGQRDALDTADRVCPTLLLVGDADPWVPLADVEALRKVWAGRPDCEIVVYPGAEHGFVHDPDRPAHRPQDAADAWRRALRFLGA